MQPIEFLGFAADCTIMGKMTMFGERLTDFLNGQERYLVHHVECESLEDGHKAAIDSVSIERSDLLAVVATGPRGNEKQRVSLQTNRLHLSIGPYMVLGRLHTKPGQRRGRRRPQARPDGAAHQRDDRLRGRRRDRRPRPADDHRQSPPRRMDLADAPRRHRCSRTCPSAHRSRRGSRRTSRARRAPDRSDAQGVRVSVATVAPSMAAGVNGSGTVSPRRHGPTWSA